MEKNVLNKAQTEELEKINNVQAVYANRIYIGIDNEVFRVTFCEEELSTGDVKVRGAFILTEQALFNLHAIIEQIAKRKQELKGIELNKKIS